MTLTKDHIGGLLFLTLSVTYWYYGQQIPLLPGDEYEPFHARTIPDALAWLGMALSFFLIATAERKEEGKLVLAGYDFGLVARLLGSVLVFALALEWVGFLLATIIFLIAGFWLLGERRIKTLLLGSVPFALFIWFALSQLLDIYLAPGKLFASVVGG